MQCTYCGSATQALDEENLCRDWRSCYMRAQIRGAVSSGPISA